MENETPERIVPTVKDLEKEKLLLEIAELKRGWWQKPAYIAAFFPTLLAIFALIYGFANGYFQASFVKLENQKYELQKEIREFTHQKVELSREQDRLQARNAELADQLSNVLAALDPNGEGNTDLSCDEKLAAIDKALFEFQSEKGDGH